MLAYRMFFFNSTEHDEIRDGVVQFINLGWEIPLGINGMLLRLLTQKQYTMNYLCRAKIVLNSKFPVYTYVCSSRSKHTSVCYFNRF